MAGSTLATFAEKDGMTLICVVMKEQAPNHYQDTRTLFDYCFENFQLWNVAENEKNYSQNIKENKIFENEESFVGLNKEGCIVLPKAVEFTDAVPEIVEINNSKDVIGNIQYTYAGRSVGGTDIEITGAKVSEYKFRKAEKEEKEEEAQEDKVVVNINVKYIILGVLAVALLIGIGFGIYKFVDNFYLIKYKIECRRQRKMSYKDLKFKKKKDWK